MTRVREAWKDLVRITKENQIHSPTREVRLLLAKVLGTSPSRVYLFWDLDLSSDLLQKLYALLEERLHGVPLQYVLGEWEFLSLNFEMEKGVFIPRFDTEAWVEEAIIFLRLLVQREGRISLCDVGCGSGVIGISCAFWVPQLQVYGVDISAQAVALSRRNAQRLKVNDRVLFWQSDLFEVFQDMDVVFDVILANPPYISLGEWEYLAREIREYEPEEALVAGSDGLEMLWRIVKEGSSFLKEGGFFFLEHDPRQKENIEKMVAAIPSLEYCRCIHDYNGKARASVLRKKRGSVCENSDRE
ncbi:MAG: peptide chain release factor N(5)-glutamine methyltransferase [Candidatus Caldatribacteriaceae bacterium]